MPVLYVVATPIGNLEDISLRAIRVLREVKLIAAEDTRKTRRLLARYDIRTPLTSYFEHNKLAKLDGLLERLESGDIALVSEAGMPGISDPGYELIAAAAKKDIPVVPVPGPSAITAALAVSGLPTDRFLYIGFLPNRAASRRRLLESVAGEPGTIIALEAPHRLPASLKISWPSSATAASPSAASLPSSTRRSSAARCSEAITRFRQPRGEFTLVIEGRGAADKPEAAGDVEKQLHRLYLAGTGVKEAVAAVAGATGLPRKELYRTWLELDKVWERKNDGG